MTTQQTASTPETKRGHLEMQYGSIGISAVVAAVEGRRKGADRREPGRETSLESLRFAQRFATHDSD